MRSGYAVDLPDLLSDELRRLTFRTNLMVEPGALTRGKPLRDAGVVVDHWSATPQRPGRQLPSRGIIRDGLNRPDLGYFLPGPLYNAAFAHDFGQPVIDVVVVACGTSNNAGKGGWLGHVGNSRTLGWNADTDGTLPWSPRMVQLMAAGNVAFLRALREADVRRCGGHYEWTLRKIDPGRVQRRMEAVRAATVTHRSRTTGTSTDDEQDDDMPAIFTGPDGKQKWLVAGGNRSLLTGPDYVDAKQAGIPERGRFRDWGVLNRLEDYGPPRPSGKRY